MSKPKQIISDIDLLKSIGYAPPGLDLLRSLQVAEDKKLRGVVQTWYCSKCVNLSQYESFVELVEMYCPKGHPMKVGPLP